MKVNNIEEKDIEKTLVSNIEQMGGLCLKWVSPGCSGVPDRIVILPGGNVHFVELKTTGKKVRPRQRGVIKRLRNLGCFVWEIDSLEMISRMIESICGEEVM